ncbi:tRNA 2-thiocytidine(32) synthetase TtcA, partial [bacterium]
MILSPNKLKTLILRRAAKTSAIFGMFPDCSKVVIGLSGGADSLVLVDIMFELSKRWRKKIEFVPVFVDAGFFPIDNDKIDAIKRFCTNREMKLQIIEKHSIAKSVQSDENPFPPCFTCSRMRRKTLLETAQSLDAKFITLGHHKDDLIETFLLNILFSRRISAIMPKQELFDGLFYIIRPMILVDEDYIKRYAKLRVFPTIEKNCPYAGDTRREWVKNLLTRMKNEYPEIKKNILRSLFHPKT